MSENGFDGFTRDLITFMQMEVKHIYYGNITKEFAQKSMSDFIELTNNEDSVFRDNLKKWTCEYLSNCASKRQIIEWHDLKKNPEDLPPAESKDGHYSVTVLNEYLDKVFYDFKNREWLEPVFGNEQREPGAWCRIYCHKNEEEDD